MTPSIQKVLDSTSKRFDEWIKVAPYEKFTHSSEFGEYIKVFLRESNLELLAAVREVAEGMKRKIEECDMNDPNSYHCNSCDSMMSCEIADRDRQYNQALSDLLTALLEGKENV